MKIIFLDIDGVLNTHESAKLKAVFYKVDDETETSFNKLDKVCVSRLNDITDRTGAKLIISSTWRILCATPKKFALLAGHLHNEGVTGEIIGRTPTDREVGYISEEYPDGSRGVRGHEIQKWLNDNKEKEIEAFAILDDSSDMVHLMPKLVHIVAGWIYGIQKSHVEEAIKMLGLKKEVL